MTDLSYQMKKNYIAKLLDFEKVRACRGPESGGLLRWRGSS